MTCPSLVGLRTEAAELSYSDQPDALGVAMRERREQQNLVRPPRRNASRRINTDQTSTKYVYITYMPETLTGRLNFRLSPEQEQALRHAAALTGQSLSGFVLSAAVDHAHDLLARANRIELSEAAFRRFVAALDEPDEAAPELVRLARRKSRIPPIEHPALGPVELLDPDRHDTARFSSDVEVLDHWLRRVAPVAAAAGTAATWVLCRGRRVVGFYALAMGSIERIRVPSRPGRGQPDPTRSQCSSSLAWRSTGRSKAPVSVAIFSSMPSSDPWPVPGTTAPAPWSSTPSTTASPSSTVTTASCPSRVDASTGGSATSRGRWEYEALSSLGDVLPIDRLEWPRCCCRR